MCKVFIKSFFIGVFMVFLCFLPYILFAQLPCLVELIVLVVLILIIVLGFSIKYLSNEEYLARKANIEKRTRNAFSEYRESIITENPKPDELWAMKGDGGYTVSKIIETNSESERVIFKKMYVFNEEDYCELNFAREEEKLVDVFLKEYVKI